MTLDTAAGALTATQVAEECGVSRQTIHAWYQEGLPKRPTRPQVMHFLANRETQTTGSMRERIAKAQALRLERENRKADGELLDAGLVCEQTLRAISFLAQDFNAVAQRISTDEAIQAKAEDEIFRARERFAAHLEELAGDRAPVARGRGRGPPKAPAHAGRVGRRGANSAAGNAGTGTVSQ